MVRNELYITVPSFFRCPISMDIMRSPVSLCTGITYDRSSIQHWLESGHDTCPATMQILPSKDFIPNHTLHRLIHLWIRSGDCSSPASRSTLMTSSSVIMSPRQVGSMIHEIETDGRDCAVLLSKIVEFVRYSDENRRFVANFDGFELKIVGVLSKTSAAINVLEMAISILNLIMEEDGAKERIHRLIIASNPNCLSSILSILENGSLNSKIESARLLESLAGAVEAKRVIAETQGLLSVLLNLLCFENDDLRDAVLSCLIATSATRSLKTQLVQFGLVHVLSKTLQEPTISISITEKSLKLLALLSTTAEGRLAISEEPKCAVAVVEKLAIKGSKAATEDGLVVLWSMCCLFQNVKVQDEVVKNNGVTKILVVMQRDCDGHVRRMCRDLVKILKLGYKDGLGRYETQTTHIMPC
ncbi:RING-type E3 ubiquitin transferase [Quillaja saponaria]|uniref:U-box domain-containing protein n=1 Tax=Quillaja saponaria TaxID=32244 RepID=A0AAD7PVK6_QUISA|nr:RING-type E3 ubiquitin transferase [Quillaja saponaria]